MTNTINNPIVQAFISDLDENIVSKEVHFGTDWCGVPYNDVVFDIINPVTGATEQVEFEMCVNNERLDRIFYVVDDNEEVGRELLEMEDLNDLYDFILMDE